MDISSGNVGLTYANAKMALKPNPVVTEEFGRPAIHAIENFMDTLQSAENVAQAGMLGKADTLSVVQALAATELAVETAVTIRDRVVEAYQEILRMPV